MQKSDQKGFTLIELLVVISIIGLLSTMAVVSLQSARQKSRDMMRVADIKQIQTALELYLADSETGYPQNTNITLGVDVKALCQSGWSSDYCLATSTTYMGLVPRAPVPADCPANNSYVYNSDDAGTYTIIFCLGNKVANLSAGLHIANPTGMR